MTTNIPLQPKTSQARVLFMLTYTTGSRVVVSRVVATPGTCLAGVQPKVGARVEKFHGEVRHVRGDAPTLERCTQIGVWVKPEVPVPGDTVWCERCKCHEVPAVSPSHIFHPGQEEVP